VRLHKAEESDFAETNSRTKVIKVPLNPAGDVGYRQLVAYPDVAAAFGGEEYLLLEWRYAGELENGAYNFDEALPHEGLVIYRVMEGDPNSRHGDKNRNLIRIVDASPAFTAFPFDDLTAFWMEDVFSLDTSPAPLGDASGVYSYMAAAPWNWKADAGTSADFQLSPGNGEKTIYAKFMDLNGQVVTETLTSLTLAEAENLPPVADAGSDQTLTDDDGDGLEWVALDGGASVDPEGTPVGYEWYEADTLIAGGMAPTVSLAVGVHTITLVVSDDRGATDSDDLRVTIVAANVPPIADAGVNTSVTDTDGDGLEPVALDGTGSYDPDGGITAYEWYESGTLIAGSATATVTLGVGSHTLTLWVVDDRGAAASDMRIVDVAEGSVAAPSDLDATVSKKNVGLAWLDNANNEAGFQVERGKKTKGVVRYSKAGSVGPNVTRYDEALAPGTYYFRVKAFGPGDAASVHSNVVKVSIKGGGKGPS
jgi:hypothetical protein